MSAFTLAPNLGLRFLLGAECVAVSATLFGMESAWASFGGNSFGDGFVILLGLTFVVPPLLAAILVGALTPSRRAAIPAGIVAGSVVSMVVSVVLAARGLDVLGFAALGAVVGLAGGILVWVWRIVWSRLIRKAFAREGSPTPDAESSPSAAKPYSDRPNPLKVLAVEVLAVAAVPWLRRSGAWGRRAGTRVVELGADLKSTGLTRGLATRHTLREKLGYSAMLILAGLALSPTTLIELTERVADSSGSSWLTAPLVAIASGLPLLSVVPAVLDVLAAVLVGPWWGAGVMLVTAGLLSPYFAGYPSLPYASVFGVMVAGLACRATGNVLHVVLGEIVGAGVIGAIANAALGIYATDTTFDWPSWVGMRLSPTCIGAVLGGLALIVMRRSEPRL